MSTPSTVAVQAQMETNFNHSHTSATGALADEPGTIKVHLCFDFLIKSISAGQDLRTF